MRVTDPSPDEEIAEHSDGLEGESPCRAAALVQRPLSFSEWFPRFPLLPRLLSLANAE